MGVVRHRERLEPLHPRLRAAIEWMAAQAPFDVYVYEGERTVEKSRALYAMGRTTGGAVVSYANGEDSPHVWRLAADCYPWVGSSSVEDVDALEWEVFGRLAKQAGMVWGGDFTRLVDKPHVELPNWRSAKNWDGKGPSHSFLSTAGWIGLGAALALTLGIGLFLFAR